MERKITQLAGRHSSSKESACHNLRRTGVTKNYSKLVLGLVLIFLAGFIVVTVLVFSGITTTADAELALYINNTSFGPLSNSFLVLASIYGREYFWIPVVGVMLILGRRDTKMLAIELAALFVVGIIAGEAIKLWMYRPRPFETLAGIITRVPRDNDSSYPSGHALIVSIGAIFSLAKFRRKRFVLLLTLEAAVVCYSRVYVGMHYPLDVVSGIFLGGFIVFGGIFAMGKFSSLRKLVDTSTKLMLKVLKAGLVSV
jgi:membrane-associated phospholipid phosphatase